jgi:Flp pilus assembly pilin Flp
MKNLRKQAQSLIEYGLILALVAIVALTVLTKLSASVNTAGTNAANSVDETSKGAMNTYCSSIKSGGTYNSTLGKCN